MEPQDISSTLGGTHSTSADESDKFIAVALLICFSLILFVAFRYASLQRFTLCRDHYHQHHHLFVH